MPTTKTVDFDFTDLSTWNSPTCKIYNVVLWVEWVLLSSILNNIL